MNIASIAEDKCTGCGCCKNSCLMDAIEMHPNAEGFLFPRIDDNRCIGCSKCYEKCIELANGSKNLKEPALYCLRADDEIRSKSSAGGMFSLLANEILSQGGYVCGAAFDGSFQLKHTLAFSRGEIKPFCGSKYLQSEVGLIYRELEAHLKAGAPMLFTGCPCQIAALYSFLGQEYPSLFTADLLCHGVPSQQLFDRYLGEIAGNRKISDIQFRDKKYGWTSLNIHILYSDGGEYEGNIKNDSFEKAFHPNLMLRKSCADCKFSSFPRYGDITMGDFWGVEKLDPEHIDRKGTSLVLVNNSKGQALFEKISNKASYIKQLDFQPKEIKNRVSSSYPPHKSRERFFELVKKNSFEKAVNYSINNHYDIGLVGIYSVENFGGAMTYFALYKALEDMGFGTLMIERPKAAKSPPKPLSLSFEQGPYPEYALSPIFQTKAAMSALNDRCDIFLTGSDQLFNSHLYSSFGRWITLDWVKDNKKKIAYSASFGHDGFWGSEEVRAEMSYFMQKFDAFSVREKSGIAIAKNDFGVSADWVLDPVFLCDKKHYFELAKRASCENNEPYIGGYILDIDLKKEKVIRQITSQLSLQAAVYTEVYRTDEQAQDEWGLPIKHGKFESRLKNIMDCDFFVTDSFHGVCFAIIFQKQFAAFPNKKRGEARMTSLLTLLGLSDRLVEGENFSQRLLEKINYQEVLKILDSEKERCRSWIYEAIASKSKKPYSDYDMLKAMIDFQSKQIKELTEKNKILEMSLNTILERASLEFITQTDIHKYFKALSEQSKDYLIVISARDTLGHYLNGEIADSIMSLGFENNVQNKHWHSYIGISNRGKLVFEAIAQQEVSSFCDDIDGISTMIESKPLHQGNEAKIVIDGVDYSMNRRGLNIVVYDCKIKKAVDSLCFDTHSSGLDCYR